MKKSMVLVVLLSLLAVLGATAGVVSLSSPTGPQATTATTTQATASLIDQGKSSLQAHNLLAARDFFRQAAEQEPTNQEANLLYGVTRVFAVFEDGQGVSSSGLDSVREIFELSGFSFQTFGIYGTQGSDPDKLASTTPRSGAVLDFVKNRVLPEVNGAISNLDTVTDTGFSSSVSPAALDGTGADLNVDYADAQVLRALLNALKCNLNLLMVYGLDVYLPDIVAAPKQMTTYKNLFADANFLAVQDAARLTTAKDALNSFIDIYTAATGPLKDLSRNSHPGHLFVVDAPVSNEPFDLSAQGVDEVASTLADIKASIGGSHAFPGSGPLQDRTADLSKLFDAAHPIDIRASLANCTTGVAPAAATFGGLFPLGLSSYAKIAAQNGPDLLGVICTGRETPKILLDPDYLFLNDSPGYASGPQGVTIYNNGTANLQVSSLGFSGPNGDDFTVSAGTCSSLAPLLLAGQSCAVTVDLKRPVAETGSLFATLQVASNDTVSPLSETQVNGWVNPSSGGSISGMVRDARTQSGIPGVSVLLYDSANGNQVRSTSTNGSGGYTISGLSGGSYKLQFAVSPGQGGGSAPYQGTWYNGQNSQGDADPVSLSSGENKTIDVTLAPPPVTLQWGAVWHRTDPAGAQVDYLDAGINTSATTLEGLTLRVDGPNGFNYTFTEADKIPYLNGRFSLVKSYTPLPAGVYTYTLTDAYGNVSYRVASRPETPRTLPKVDSATIQFQRKADGSYRFSWAPVNDARTHYYRVRIVKNDASNTPVYFSVRNPTTSVDVPQASGEANPLVDGSAYKVRVEVMDAPTVDLTTTRTDSSFVGFTPRAADYNPARLLVNNVFMQNRTDSDGTLSSEVDLQVNTPGAVSLVELRNAAGSLVDTFTPGDRSGQEFWKQITPALTPGSYSLHFTANGLDHYSYLTLTSPVSYQPPATGTLQAEDQGNGFIRFSWASADHTLPLYYRVQVQDKTAPSVSAVVFASSRLNINFVDVPKGALGDLSTKKWRVELFDSGHPSTARNRVNSAWLDLTPTPFDPARPVINSWRVRSMTSPAGVTGSQVLVNANAAQGALSSLVVTGPGGYSRDLLALGRYSAVYGGYALEEAGFPAAGLYTITAQSGGKSAVRYLYQPAAHPVPPVDFRTFRYNQEPNGGLRVSWAPVQSDVPVWYQMAIHSSLDQNSDHLMDGSFYVPSVTIDVNYDGAPESKVNVYPLASVVIPGDAALPDAGMFRVTATDGGQSQVNLAGVPTLYTNIVNNASQSVMLPGEEAVSGVPLTDNDGDGFASGLDSDDNNPAVYPYSAGNDALPLSVVSTSPAGGATGVPLTGSICANLNKVIDQRTLAGNFSVSGVTGTLSFQTAGNSSPYASSICLKPAAPLAAGTTLSASVGTGLRDPAGHPLASPFTWSFTTSAVPYTSASPAAGSYPSAQSVTLTANAAAATIYYTTDGSDPSYPPSGSTLVYSAPIVISGTTTLKYFARTAAYSEPPKAGLYSITRPSAPGWVQGIPGAGQVALSWSPSAGASSYNVYLTGVSSPVQTTGNAFRDALTSGFYWIDALGTDSSPGGTSYYQTGKVTLNPDGSHLSQSATYWDSASRIWSSTPPEGFTPGETRIKLTPGGWVEANDDLPESVLVNADGSMTAIATGDQSQQRLTLSIVELAGVPIGAAGGARIPVLPGALVYPAGARRYDMTQTQMTESYRINNGWVPEWVSTLEQLPGAFTFSPLYLDSNNNNGTLSFEAYFNYSNNSVDIKQHNNSTGISTSIGTGTWDIRNVYGQQLLVLTIPPQVRSSYQLGSDPFFAVVTGMLKRGDHAVVGDSKVESSFNKIALDHLQANLSAVLTMPEDNPPIARTVSGSFVHGGLSANTTYSYQVTAVNGVGESNRAGTSVTVLSAGSDSAAPSVSFTLPAASNSLTVSFATLALSDNNAVSAFYLSENPAAPGAGAAGWIPTTPSSFTFSGTGSRTLYLWARDVAGNVSPGASATVNIDLTAPVVSFSAPATSSSLTVSLALSASDTGSGVAGYQINETGLVPSAGAAGWSASAPTSYSFSGPGPHTLFIFVKDAAGNVSSRSAAISVNLSWSLTVQDTGTGTGTVTSAPAGISCISGSSAGCSASFASASVVSLTPTASLNSYFSGWGGACVGTGSCQVTMDAARSVTANFTANPATVRIDGQSANYYNLGGTLDLISTAGQTVRAMERVFSENVVMTSPVEILLKGGFTDNLFSLRSGASVTVIDGSLKIRKGALRVERLTVR